MLDFIQVDAEFINTRSRAIAALLKRRRNEVIGMGNQLIQYAIEATSTDESPPDGVILDPDWAVILEGAMEWDGEAGKCADAFVRAGVIQKLEVGARVRGTERYEKTWKERQRSRERLGALRERSANNRGNAAAKPRLDRGNAAYVPPGEGEVDASSSKKGGAQVAPPPPEVRTVADPLRDRLDAVFLEVRRHAYVWCFADEQAFRKILNQPDEEILRRWRLALKRQVFPRAESIQDLVKHWNAYGSDPPARGEHPKDARKGHVRAEDNKHSEVVGEIPF